MQQKILLLNQIKSERKGLYDTLFFARYWLGIDLNPFQERVMGEIDKALWGGEYSPSDLIELLMNAGNRTGKTLLLAVLHIKFARYKIGVSSGEGYENFKYRTFAISPISRQARECGHYIEDILEGRLTWLKDGKRYSNNASLKLRHFFAGKNENLGEYRYQNNSITYAFSTGSDMGAGFQGLPGGLVTYDEAVQSHHLEEELDSHIYSRLGDYGKLMVLIATPDEIAPSQQYYYHLVQESRAGNNNYLVLGGSYKDNIFIPLEKRMSHIKTLQERDPVLAKQIVEGAFVSTGGAMFSLAIIEQLWNGLYKGQNPKLDHQYLLSADWGMAEGGDETVFLVWDTTDVPINIVWAYAKRGGDPYELLAVYRNLILNYNNAISIMDTASLGGTILKKMLKDLRPIPFDGTGGEKEKALAFTKILLTKNRKKREVAGEEIDENKEFGWIRSFYLPRLATQLATYKVEDSKIRQDWVSAFYIGCYYLYKKFAETENRAHSVRLNPFRRKIILPA